MSKRLVLTVFVLVFISFQNAANGMLTSFSANTDFTWSPSGAIITQTVFSSNPPSIVLSAEAQSIFNVQITTTNEIDFTWTGYVLSLDPEGDATFVEDSASSTKFNTVSYPDAWTIEFEAPQAVLPGEVVTLEFDISIPDDHSYTFELTQTPIPEPATFVLLGFGGVLLFYTRTKNK
jgi:hypothetical protein